MAAASIAKLIITSIYEWTSATIDQVWPVTIYLCKIVGENLYYLHVNELPRYSVRFDYRVQFYYSNEPEFFVTDGGSVNSLFLERALTSSITMISAL